MKIPSEKEIIIEVERLKKDMRGQDFQLGIGGLVEDRFFNRINKILRMLKQPCRRVPFAKLGKSELMVKICKEANKYKKNTKRRKGE